MLILGLWTGLQHGVRGLATADGQRFAIFAILSLAFGLGLTTHWARDDRRNLRESEAMKPESPASPP